MIELMIFGENIIKDPKITRILGSSQKLGLGYKVLANMADYSK